MTPDGTPSGVRPDGPAPVLRGRLRPRIGFAVIALIVFIVHLWIADRVRDELDQASRAATDIGAKRMSVAYVRELKPIAPVARYVAPPPPPPAPASRKKATAAAKAASAALADAAKPPDAAASDAQAAPDAAMAAASAPEPVPEPNAEASSTASAAGSSPDASATTAGAAAAASASAASEASGAKPFEWPASTRLSYVLTGSYRGEVHGSAQVEWIKDDLHYQVHLDVTVGAEFAPLFTRKMTSDGRITPQGLAPRRYDEDTKVAFQARRVNAVLFDQEMVTLSNGTQVKRPEGYMPVQDSASQFVQLTWLFSTRPELLEVGRQIEVPLALSRSMDVWVYDVFEKETLYTNFGALEALHLKPRRLVPSDNPRSNALTAEVWFAPTLAYLPVRILIHQNADTYLDLMISRLPQMAAASK